MFIQLVVSPLRKYGLVFVLCLFPLGQIAGIYQQFPAVFAARPVNLYDSPVQPLTGAADNRIILVIGFPVSSCKVLATVLPDLFSSFSMLFM